MKRHGIKYLQNWLNSSNRKPLVLRGARQVGKTWIVRHLAQLEGKKLIELNFEKQPRLTSIFKPNDPSQILINLEAVLQFPILPKDCILFLDEIQAAPELLAKLRWFGEELNDLPVIAAGSLLEFALADHNFSMPVGRITYMHLEPLSFEEYLMAHNKEKLCEYLMNYHLDTTFPDFLHEQLLTLFKEYIIIGGMPDAVSDWIENKSLMSVNRIHNDLLATFRDDFSKYSKHSDIQYLDEIMIAIPRMLGQKFAYSKVNPAFRGQVVKRDLDLLNKAKVCYRVVCSAANGLPLGSETRANYFKEIFLDTGMACAALGLNLSKIQNLDELTLINRGGVAEQIVGQTLRTIYPFYVEPTLYYWHREEKGSNAEVDYVVQHGTQVLPIEVKAGNTGGLKSLHLFMQLKGLSKAVRINSDFATKTNVQVKDQLGKTIKYNLLSLPFYLLSQMHRLLDEA